MHLPEDYMKFGSLNQITAFLFENYLGAYVKGRLSGRNKPLQQICRLVLNENEKSFSIEPPKVDSNSKVLHNKTVFKTGLIGARDNGVLLKSGKLGVIRSIKDNNLSIDVYRKSSYFIHPVDLQLIGIFKLTDLIEQVIVQKNDIHSKVMILPRLCNFIAITLLHDNLIIYS